MNERMVVNTESYLQNIPQSSIWSCFANIFFIDLVNEFELAQTDLDPWMAYKEYTLKK